MKKSVPAAVLLALGLASAGRAGWTVAKADDEKAAGPKPATPLTLQVVFSRYQGDKKVASAPYSFPLNANEHTPAKLRMGINVPLRTEVKDSPSNIVYKSVGNNMDCTAETADGGRFRVRCSLEQSSIYSSGPGDRMYGAAVDGPPPLLRTFNTEATLYLRDVQTGQYAMATDPVTGEVLKVEVTLTVIK